MKTDELIARLEEQERLLLLEKRHLREVMAQELDDSTARWVVDIRKREIIKLRAWLRKVQSNEVEHADAPLDRRRRRRPTAREALTTPKP
jgi:hypothetical protein